MRADVRNGRRGRQVDGPLADPAAEGLSIAGVAEVLLLHAGVHREDLGGDGAGRLVQDGRDLRGLCRHLDARLGELTHVHGLELGRHAAQRGVGVRDRLDQFLGASPAALDQLGHRRRGGVDRPAAAGGGELRGKTEIRQAAHRRVQFPV
ncbi:hypothetical protein PV350_37960 [Streptomyces sp. PA03-6a]|nr:hypothetical protein [Streptomyces sp. PA03-6a]